MAHRNEYDVALTPVMLTRRDAITPRATRSLSARRSRGLCGARFRVVASHVGPGARVRPENRLTNGSYVSHNIQ